jgi:exosortase
VTGATARALPDTGFLVLALGLVGLYGPLAPELARDWSRSGDFSHGWVVAPATAWMLWQRRDALRSAPVGTWVPGGILLGLAIVQYLLGAAASEFWLLRTSIVPWSIGCVGLMWGRERARLCVFPLAFLLFMIPPPSLVWNTVALPLQLLASRAAETALAVGGVEVLRTGNVLQLDGVALEVAQACSGLRSLVALLALGAVLAEGSLVGGGPRSAAFRWAVFLSAIPVAVAANALRVAATALTAAKLGDAAVTGRAHEIAGLAMFVVSFGLLWLGRSGLGWIERRVSGSSPRS